MATKHIFSKFFIILFCLFPFYLFYLAFYSNNSFFKNLVNNNVEIFYLFFIVLAVLFSFLVSNYFLKSKYKPSSKFLILLFIKALIVVYGIFLVLNSFSRYVSYKSQAIDMAFFNQVIWQLSEFKLSEIALSQHFSPILLIFVPFFWIAKSNSFLMLAQSIFVISAGIPLYLASKHKLQSEFLPIALVFAYLSFGGIQFGYAYGFHEIMLFPAFFFWGYYFYLKNKFKTYILFLILSLLVKEEVTFIIIFWGLYLALKKQYKYAISSIVIGILWYILTFHVVFPAFNKGGFGYWGQYPGEGLLGILQYAIFNPIEFLKTLITPKYKIDTILHSYGTFSFLSFLSPSTLIVTTPSLLEKLLSNNIAAASGFHYSAAIGAVVLVSVIEAIYNIKKKKIFEKLIKNKNIFLGVIIFYVAVLANILYGYHPLSPLHIGKETGLSDAGLLYLEKAINLIPKDATVASQYYIRPHLKSPYWLVKDGPSDNETYDYVIVNTELPLVLWETEHIEKNVNKIMGEGNYEIIVNAYGTLLFRNKRLSK
ncbi:MAG: hypothetical protein A2171_00980 [Candidatus Levybacteria bacterium RBG_13_35_9]|nr:MAG: hypothetical protein A2171_00980 [Candidatus Levybacteria bacterium RBG_13_35_9]